MKNLFKKKYRELKQWPLRIYLAFQSKSHVQHIPKVKNAGCVEDYNGSAVQIMHNGVRVMAGGYHGRSMTYIIKILKGHHEAQEEKVFYEVLKHIPEKAIMVEVGSFWAYYSLWFSKSIKDAKNYLIEPVLSKRKLSEFNFALNDIEIHADAYFIGEPTKLGDRTSISSKKAIECAKEISLDEYIALKNIKKIDILHADIQGAELDLLKGAPKSLKASKIDYIFISTHSYDIHKECVDILLDNNYVLIAEHSIEQSSSADGLIVAASKNAAFKSKIDV